MSTRFQVSFGLEGLEETLSALGNSAPLIMSRALNRAAVSGKTAMTRAISADIGIQSKNVAREIQLDKATRSRPVAVVQIKGSRIPLIAFKATGQEPTRGRGRGVSWTNQGQRKREPHAFIATMPSGHRGVFEVIRNKARRGPRQPTHRGELPIRELFGPSLPHVFEKFFPVFEAAASESFRKNIVSEINFEKPNQAAE